MSTVPWFTASFSASQVLLHLQSLQHQCRDHDYRNTRNSFRISFYVAHIKQEYLDNSENSLVAIHFKSALYSAREQAVTLTYRPAFLPRTPHCSHPQFDVDSNTGDEMADCVFVLTFIRKQCTCFLIRIAGREGDNVLAIIFGIRCIRDMVVVVIVSLNSIAGMSLNARFRAHSATITPEFGSFQPAGDGPKFVHPNKWRRFNSNDSRSLLRADDTSPMHRDTFGGGERWEKQDSASYCASWFVMVNIKKHESFTCVVAGSPTSTTRNLFASSQRIGSSSFTSSISSVIFTTGCCRELFASVKMLSSMHESQRTEERLHRREHQSVRNGPDGKCNHSLLISASYRSSDLTIVFAPLAFWFWHVAGDLHRNHPVQILWPSAEGEVDAGACEGKTFHGQPSSLTFPPLRPSSPHTVKDIAKNDIITGLGNPGRAWFGWEDVSWVILTVYNGHPVPKTACSSSSKKGPPRSYSHSNDSKKKPHRRLLMWAGTHHRHYERYLCNSLLQKHHTSITKTFEDDLTIKSYSVRLFPHHITLDQSGFSKYET
ncbi:uncharacterized protein ARMOST_17794 [Armillaria ostoyae]|uniref:Uncharacterized protein n=1 Tax=Armillaria ostoyae TaxID=47428 RepID=A0A284RZZ2_ARMOS|nr:uncharacterized protein ARMOST_17794 [Armillaria ostoyae]